MELKQALEQLCLTSATAGAESEMDALCRQLMGAFGTCSTDKRGNFICRKEGAGKHFLLDAHMDQIGFAVTAIEEGGFLKLAKVGGTDARVSPSQEVLVLAKEPLFGVIACKPPHLSDEKEKDKAPEMGDLSVDTGLDTEQLKALVSLGDRVVFAPRFEVLQDTRVCATSLDDRAGMAIIFRVMQLLKQAGSKAKISAVFSVQEEVNGQGALNASYAAQADEAIVVDVSFALQPELSEKAKQKAMPLGGGAFIAFAPILDRQMSKAFLEIAAKEDISCRAEVMGGTTGTNADEIARARCGTKTVCISPPIRNMHTPVEIADLRDLESCARLIAHYIMSREDDAS